VNKNDINMHWVYQYAPKTIGSVHLEFYNPNSPRGHQIFVSLWASVKNYPLVKDKTESSVIKAKEALKKIADTIDLRPRHE